MKLDYKFITETKLEITYDFSDPYNFTTAILQAHQIAKEKGYRQAWYLGQFYEGKNAIAQFRLNNVPRGTKLTDIAIK